MNQRKWKKIIFAFSAICVLVVTFWYGGNSDSLHGFSVSGTESEKADAITEFNLLSDSRETLGESEVGPEQKPSEKDNIFQQIVMHIKKKDVADTSNNTQNNKKAQKNANRAVRKNSSKKKKTTSSGSDKKSNSKTNRADNPSSNNTDSDASSNNSAQTSENTNARDSEYDKKTENTTQEHTNSTEKSDSGTITCTIYISCATLIDHMDSLKSEAKKRLVPKDGIILKKTTVKVKEGSTVFDVLKSVTKEKGIHLEYSFTPMFNSYYIEGIYNLYEFDGGDLSGWMYNVNGEFPSYGCSEYKVANGDEIKWLYTCDLGRDVGCYFME